jgi:hypothetical protein
MAVSLATIASLQSLVLDKAASENEPQHTDRAHGRRDEGGQKPVVLKQSTIERYPGSMRPDRFGRYGCLDL